MGILLRIILAAALIGVFIFIIFSSFFYENAGLELPNIEKPYIGTTTLGNGSGSVYESHFSLYDSLYHTHSGALLSRNDDEEVHLEIQKESKYLSSFHDISKNYSFFGEGFKLLQEGIGEIYIDTTSPGKVFVMPLNTSAVITLTNSSGEEEYTHIFLGPHMYIEFQPARGKFLKNADVVRVETVYKLGYFAQQITQMREDSFLKKFYDNTTFLDISLEKIGENYEKRSDELQLFSEQKVGIIPGSEMILRYMHLLVNEEKKKVFYKNMLLTSILELTQSNSYDDSLVPKIRKDLQVLQKIDIDSYTKMTEILDHMSMLVYSDYEKRSIIPKIYFAEIQTGESSDTAQWYFDIYGFSLYGKYDFGNMFLPFYAQKYHGAFRQAHSLTGEQGTLVRLRYQYFSYFLEKQLEFLLSTNITDTLVLSINNTLSNLIDAISVSYTQENTDRVTALYIYSGILKNLDTFMRRELFLSERNARKLLELPDDTLVTQEEVNTLHEKVSTIEKFLNDSKLFLESKDSRDITVKKDILESLERLTEYFSALENHEVYKKNYDVTIQGILGTDVFGGDGDIVLGREHAMEYLQTFLGVDTSSVDIKVVDDFYYSISNIYIAGKNFSFDLYPFSSYKIDNISIDGKGYNFVYKLQKIEGEWIEKYEAASENEKDKYDFSRFFLITFFSQSDVKVEEYIVKDTTVNEDKAEIVFKRDILLGEKGEFKILDDILKIEYEDITLEDKGSGYDIFIDNARVGLPVLIKGEKMERKGYINSDYVFNSIDHYFNNLKLQVLVEKETVEEVFEFDGKSIHIAGKVHISEFREVLEEIFSYISLYSEIYANIGGKYGSVDITMNYSVYSNKMSFKFDYDGKPYSILVSGDQITSVYKGTQKLVDEAISSSQLLDYLE